MWWFGADAFEDDWEGTCTGMDGSGDCSGETNCADCTGVGACCRVGTASRRSNATVSEEVNRCMPLLGRGKKKELFSLRRWEKKGSWLRHVSVEENRGFLESMLRLVPDVMPDVNCAPVAEVWGDVRIHGA